MGDGRDPPDEGWGNIETAIVPSGLPESGRSRPCLVVLSGSQVGEMVRVEQGLTVGRGRDAGLRVADEGVSREHFRLVQSADGDVELHDAGSSNGTFVNGRSCESR